MIHEFLQRLANHLESGEELDIRIAEYPKFRLPVLAKRYVIREGDVLDTDRSARGKTAQRVAAVHH